MGPTRSLTGRGCLGVLLLGAALRVIALPLPGTLDVSVWKIWSYAAATSGVTQVYGVGGDPPERRSLAYDGRRVVVDYPPLALYELGLVGRLYQAVYPEFPNTRALNVAVKLPVLLADLGVLALIILAVRRLVSEDAARMAAAVYWLNPATILDGVVLGYLDLPSALPALAALVLAARRPSLAGVLLALGVLTKAQAIFLTPVLALALWRGGGLVALSKAAAAATFTATAAVAPYVLAGAGPNMLQAIASLGRHDMLSGTAANLWWIVTYVMRAVYAAGDLGVWTAFTMPVQILAISRVTELGYPNPRPIGVLMVLGVAGWAIWRLRRARDVFLQAGLAAFVVLTYFVLAAQVHENHLFPAVPLLVLAASGRPAFRPLTWALSLILALNLNLFYGFGHQVGYAVPRSLALIDLSVPLAMGSVAVLVWFARVLISEGSRADALPRSPARATAPAPEARSRT